MNDTNYLVTKGLPTDVVFGDPRKRCAGHGICRVTAPGALLEQACGCLFSRAYLKLDEAGQSVKFSFPVELIDPQIRQIYFSNHFFLMESDVTLSQSILGDQRVLLKKGIYPLISDKNFLQFSVKCVIQKKDKQEYASLRLSTTEPLERS